MQGQGSVESPACSGCSTGHEEARGQHDRRRNHQPETEVIHAGKGHVGGADLQRQHPVRKAHKGRHDGAEHHDQTVHGGELVEQAGVHQLQTWLEQLSTDAQRQDAADHQHGKSKQQVQGTDVFVVGGIHPTAPARGGVVVVVVMRVVVVQYCTHGRFL